MDLEYEKARMKDFLDEMTINEFDDMLERSGINTIKPSYMSTYVLAVSETFSSLEYSANYNDFKLNHYENYNNFEGLEGY